MINNNFKSVAKPQYEAPAIAVLEIENENAICAASTQQFEVPGLQDTDNDLLDW